MRLHVFKSVKQFTIDQHRLKREAMKQIRAKLCEAINARKQSDTFPAWMEREAQC
jgi:hypothetical protein